MTLIHRDESADAAPVLAAPQPLDRRVPLRRRLKPRFPVEPQALLTLRPRHGMRMILERR
jgi:hypothetical protein